MRYGPVGAAVALAIASAARASLLWFFTARLLSITAKTLVFATWRTFVAIGVMFSGVSWLEPLLFSHAAFGTALLDLLILSASGAVLYVAAHLILWQVSGRPQGPETATLSLLRGPATRWLGRHNPS
jgi:peptidoglycan biosynthesis protein MviN/MurJ (putative lipid II flippase)